MALKSLSAVECHQLCPEGLMQQQREDNAQIDTGGDSGFRRRAALTLVVRRRGAPLSLIFSA